MLYEYHTDATRKLNELGRMFCAIHRKETGKNLLDNDEFNRVINECHNRIHGRVPKMQIVLNGFAHETAVRLEISTDYFDEDFPIRTYEIAQEEINRVLSKKIEDEWESIREMKRKRGEIE